MLNDDTRAGDWIAYRVIGAPWSRSGTIEAYDDASGMYVVRVSHTGERAHVSPRDIINAKRYTR
jgi:hypothetical protein